MNHEDKDGWTALMLAARYNQSEVAKVLLDNGANVNHDSKDDWTALMLAARNNQSEVAKVLLDNGANVNYEDKDGWTALRLAARYNYSEVAKVLLDNGANVNHDSKDDWTALMLAARNNQSEVAKVLLENGADVNYENKNGFTALVEAAIEGQSEVAKVLLENGADVNYENKNGFTALTWATYKGQSEVTKVLLECGANPDIRDTDGDNAWDLAKDKPIVFAILTKHLNDVVNGRKFPPCDKVATNKQNPTQPEVAGGIEADKLPKEHNIAERVFENTWRSVVYVDTYDAQGSGVIIRPNLVATNCHVVESANNIQVYKAEERRTNRDVSYNATIIKQDEANDFCVLSVDGLWGIPATIRKYNTINIGEDVYGLGAPKGLDLSLSTGVVSQLRKDDEQRLIQTDTAISPGSSGGGLFDSEGNLIGILTEKIVDEDAEGLGFAIPADLVL